MNTVLLSEFEANCHWFLEQVEKSNNPLILIKNGKPFTQILPYQVPQKSLFGLYKNQIEIKGDILSPIETEWNVLK
jgi:hypothetical protein